MVKKVRFWEWDEQFGHEKVRLRDPISELLDLDLIRRGNREDEFELKQNPLIRIISEDGIVNSIVFLQVSDVPFIEDPKASGLVDHILKPIPELNGMEVQPQNYTRTDVFLMTFRDSQPSIAMILSKRKA